jgi:hypothetical protein
MDLNGSGGRLPVVIRAMGGRDLPGLLRMRRGGVRLDAPDSLVSGYTPFGGIVQGRWNPLRGSRIRTYVASANRAPVAFVQAREHSLDPRKWDLLYLGAARVPAAATPERRVDLWTALLDYTTAAAGRRGVQRLFARVAGTSEVAEAFHAAGYTRYGEETIYLLHGVPRGDPAALEGVDELELRPQQPGDTWALHRLYTLTAPKTVQYAEAHTSHRWELPKRGMLASRGGPRERGFVVERGREIVIYCRVARQGNRTRLGVVFEPTARELLEPTLGAILRWLDPGPGERVYCAVREFQAELGGALLAHGFIATEVQDALVRYTVVSVRSPALALVGRPARERRLAGGVPAGSLRRQALPAPDEATGRCCDATHEVMTLVEI